MAEDIVLRHTSDGVIILDQQWLIARANPRAEMLLQRSAAELEGSSLWTAVPDLEGSPAEPLLRRLQETKMEQRVEHFSPTRYVWLEFRGMQVDGLIYLFFRDVTDRARQMQTEAVRTAVRQILVDAPVPITITRGPEHRFELVNARARQLISGRNVEGLSLRAAFPELDERLIAVFDQVYATGVPFSSRDLLIRFDRTGHGQMEDATFDVTYQPLFESDGRVWGILNVSVETTAYAKERRRLEEQENAV